MVATVTPLKSSAQAVSYYEKDGYYARDDPEHRDASFWEGDAARDAGLRGHVLPGEFEDVLDGWVPGTEIRLGRMREGEHDHRPGWDITFSAPKSVSLEGLVIGDRRVIRAHDDAVRATLKWIETDLLQTRGWDPMTRQRPRVAADGMIVAGFRHLASRGGDPQLHTHCVLANMTRNASGEWRSVEPTMIRRSEKLIGAYYRNELARRLQSLGMAVTPTLIGRVPGFELAGYEKSFLDAFSGRRAEILAYLKEHDLPYNARNAQIAALHTRPAKKEIGLSQLVPQWRARAREMGLERDKAALRPARPVDPATGRQVPPVEVPPPDLPANRHLTRALAAEIASYEPGDTVVFHGNAYGCEANDVCTVTGKRPGRVILLHPDGGERSFRPAGNAKNYLGLFDTERIELRAGERIRWTRNRKPPRPRGGNPPQPYLVNGGEAEIVEIGYERVRFRDGGNEFSLSRADPQLRHLDHAYCTTVHAAQGKTARAAIAVLDAGGAADQEMFHVEISRVRREFLLLTDDREALIELLEGRAGGEEGALEALGIDPAAMPSEARRRSMPAATLSGWEDLRKREQGVLDMEDALRAKIPEGELTAHLASFGAGPERIGEEDKEIREGITRDAEARLAEERRRAEEASRAAEQARIAEGARMAADRAREARRQADERREREKAAGREPSQDRATTAGKEASPQPSLAERGANRLAARLDACMERRDRVLERARDTLGYGQPVAAIGMAHGRLRRQTGRALKAGRELLGDERYAPFLDRLGGRARIEAAIDRLERAAVLDHFPTHIAAGWEQLDKRVRETGGHRYFLPEHRELCGDMADMSTFVKGEAAWEFMSGERDMRARMDAQASRLDEAADGLWDHAAERARSEARGDSFVRREDYPAWRHGAELAVTRATEILADRRTFAPHFEHDPDLPKTLRTVSAELRRSLREDSSEWERVRSERAEEEMQQRLQDRSRDRGFSM